MKKENQEKIFEILKPVIEYIKDEMGIDCKPSIFRSNYGAIKVSLNEEQDLKLREFLENKDCAIFTYDEWLRNGKPIYDGGVKLDDETEHLTTFRYKSSKPY